MEKIEVVGKKTLVRK